MNTIATGEQYIYKEFDSYSVRQKKGRACLKAWAMRALSAIREDYWQVNPLCVLCDERQFQRPQKRVAGCVFGRIMEKV